MHFGKIDRAGYFWIMPNGEVIDVSASTHMNYARAHPEKFRVPASYFDGTEPQLTALLKSGAIRVGTLDYKLSADVSYYTFTDLKRQARKIYELFSHTKFEKIHLHRFEEPVKNLEISLDRIKELY